VRSAARTVSAAAPAGVVIAVAWLRFEQPLGSLWRAVALVGLALVAAALPGWWLRAAGSVVATVVALRLAFGVWLLPHAAASSSLVATRFRIGFLDFYSTHLPFDPRAHIAMAEVVLAAVFCFALLTVLLAAARLPLATALAFLAGAGWPATLLGPSQALAMGTAILVTGLTVLAVLGSRRIPLLAVPVAGVAVLAAVVVGSATAGHNGVVRWQSWSPEGGGGPPSVSFVWTPQYAGLHWPQQTTVVLDIESHTPPSYLRAAVLDDFASDSWQLGPPRPVDSLEPPAALRPANQIREDITVQALADTHLVGGSVPIRYDAHGAPISQPERGFALLSGGLPRGFRYTVWSYSPRPTAGELARSKPVYPAQLLSDGMFDVGSGIQLPPFGSPQREKVVREDLVRTPELYPYRPLVRLAEHVTRGARSPYEAVLDLERWFLVGDRFQYSNRGVHASQPLVAFVAQTRRGYCQYFAGAMALMLRYLGVPARVAVGFAGPTYDSSGRAWLVTDHDAHAWVEVWFRGFGWLPFDPTPPAPGSTRAPLVAAFKHRGGSAESVPSPGIFARIAANGSSSKSKGGLSRGQITKSGRAGPGGGHISFGLLLALVLLGGIVGVAATKIGLRLVRRAERDPRRVATACREELAAFLLDQRIEPARSATVRELGDTARRHFGVDADPFVAAATAARFGRAEEAEEAALAARRELRALLDVCRRALSRRERLLGLLSLRSLLRARPAVDASASLGSTGA
jgi:transglutaminase-like putative cysteine protease